MAAGAWWSNTTAGPPRRTCTTRTIRSPRVDRQSSARRPADIDLALLDAGQAPAMPDGHTKHPEGRPPLEPDSLRAIWFEEGDGVAIFEDGELAGRHPRLVGHVEGDARLQPGSDRADAVRLVTRRRRWRAWARASSEAAGLLAVAADPQAWAQFQQGMLGHLLARVGPGARYWDVSASRQPLVGVSERPPIGHRNYTVLSTVGMCCQRMPGSSRPAPMPQTGPGSSSPSRRRCRARGGQDLPVAGPAPVAGGRPGWARPDDPLVPRAATFPLGGGNEAMLLLDEPGRLLGPEVPDLSGFTVAGDRCSWLWVVPISEPGAAARAERGAASLVNAVGVAAPQLGRRLAASRALVVGRRDRKTVSSNQTTGETISSESIRSSTPPCPGSTEPMSLMSRSRLIIDSARSPRVAAATAAAPRTMPCQTLPCSRDGQHDCPGRDAEQRRSGESLPGLLRADGWGPAGACRTGSRRSSRRIAADGQHRRRERPVGAVRPGQHQRDETASSRQVGQREDAGRDVAQVPLRAAGQPPGEQAG